MVKRLLFWVILFVCVGITSFAQDNIALNKAYRMSPQPNYKHCTEQGDAVQLTDGVLSEGTFWVQKEAVGWQNVMSVEITIDLGEDLPMGGASFRTAAGRASVTWPSAILLLVSLDGETYHMAGDLVSLSQASSPPEEGYGVHTYTTNALKTHGRFVKVVVVPSGPYTFCDEISLIRGDDTFMSASLGKEVDDMTAYLMELRLLSAVRHRFKNDLRMTREKIESADCKGKAKKKFLDRLTALEADMQDALATIEGATFKTIFPFNAWHREVFAVRGDLWEVSGVRGLLAWPTQPLDPLSMWEDPPAKTGGAVRQEMMLNEVRSATFNVISPTEKVKLSLTGSQATELLKAVQVHEVAWTDTRSGQPVAAALIPLAWRDGTVELSVPKGMMRQVWFRIDSGSLKAGALKSSIVLSIGDGQETVLPLEVVVHPIQFPVRPSLHLGGWDYTDTETSYEVNPKNKEAFVAHLRSRHVDVPWAHSVVMPSGSYDEQGRMSQEPATELFDRWIALWPDARIYAVFSNVGTSFDGSAMGTALFETKVSRWISWWADYLETKGLKAEQLLLLLVDEPHSPEQDERILTWAKVIKKAEPDVILWEDPIPMDLSKSNQEMLDICDVLCPNRPRFLSVTPYREPFLERAAKGQQIWFYSCSGPARLLDPYSYHRLQAWHCFQIGAKSTHFWAFGDGGKASSWNEYYQTRNGYTPLFLDESSVTPGKHMEAIAESVQDYEYLVMLENALGAAEESGKDRVSIAKSRNLLDDGVQRVLEADGVNGLSWNDQKNRNVADEVRIEVLRAILSLQ